MLKLTPAMAHLRWHTSNRLNIVFARESDIVNAATESACQVHLAVQRTPPKLHCERDGKRMGTSFARMPVSVNKATPFARALALQSSGRNCSPAPDLVLGKLILQRIIIIIQRSVFFTDAGSSAGGRNKCCNS